MQGRHEPFASRDGSPPGAAPGRALTVLAWGILTALLGILAFVHPRFLLGTLVGDDAGYYVAVARNACLGHGFSFDRVDATNGFNPLMPMLLIPLDRLFAPGLDLIACFRIAALVSWLALAWSLVSARRLAASVLPAFGLSDRATGPAVGAYLFFLAAFVAPKGYYGMDAFLVLALGLAYAAAVARVGTLAPGRWPALRDAALLAGLVLARVDSLPLVVAALMVTSLAARHESHGGRRLVARVALIGAAIAPYAAWNRVVFGEWLPISARLKSSFPDWEPSASLRTVLHSSLNPADVAVVFATLVAAAAWLGFEARRRGQPAPTAGRGARDAMAILALGLGARLSWLLAFSRLDVQGSYFILAPAFLALCTLVAAAHVAAGRWIRAAPFALVLGGTALLAAKLGAALPEVAAIGAGKGDEWALARRIHDRVAPGDVIFGGALGLIGYIADRAWINGDGVANTRAFQDAIHAGDLAGHLARRSVDHVVVTVTPPQEPGGAPIVIRVASHLHGSYDSLVIAPRDILLRERMRRGGGSELWLARWRPAAAGQASPDSPPERHPSR